MTIISCASLLGAFVVPFMNQSFYKILLLFMVSLAVGVLSGSGVFHLVPHVGLFRKPCSYFNFHNLRESILIMIFSVTGTSLV